jgi:hypothetical protein
MMQIPRIAVIAFLILVFLSGIIVILNDGIKDTSHKEGMETQNGSNDNPVVKNDCPDMLIKKGNSLLLYNTTAPTIEGINPIPFYSMDEYINYLEIQRSRGIRCPVLYMQLENDVQGNDVYRMHPSPFYVEGGIPSIPITTVDNTIPVSYKDANMDNPPYNQNMYPGFDPHAMDVGRTTNIDIIHNSTNNAECSANAADSRWCGPAYTNQAIERGEYTNEVVSRVIYPNVHPK